MDFIQRLITEFQNRSDNWKHFSDTYSQLRHLSQSQSMAGQLPPKQNPGSYSHIHKLMPYIFVDNWVKYPGISEFQLNGSKCTSELYISKHYTYTHLVDYKFVQKKEAKTQSTWSNKTFTKKFELALTA